jgi:nucleotide-binding universal stress UspA family protein
MNILWTFDPFEKNKNLQIVGSKILKTLTNRNDLVKVVYVASNSEAQLATAYGIDKEKRYSDYPKKLIQRELIKLREKKLAIEVLSNMNFSISSSVKMLSQFAKKSKVDLILMATNGKSLLPRLIFGSFAETFVHTSVCDILIYHQKTKVGVEPPKNILYAHDFSLKGTKGFLRVTEFAKKWNSDLTIVHIVKPEYSRDSSDSTYRQAVLAHSQKIEKSLLAQKIKATIYLETIMESPADLILKVARKSKADMVAVAALSGNLTALLGGSVTRQVLRKSTLLTLVLKV